MIARTRRCSLLAAFALVAALAALATTIGAQSSAATTDTVCKLGTEKNPSGSKPTLNLSLTRRNGSCHVAKSIMKSFHRCRPKSGYGCDKKRKRYWTCRGKKLAGDARSFTGAFTCTRGVPERGIYRRIDSTYLQNT